MRFASAVGAVILFIPVALTRDDGTAGVGGSVPGTFRAFIAVDDRYPPDNPRNRANRIHCLVIENGLHPVCAVFTRTDAARAANGPLGALIAELDGVVRRNRANNAAAFVQFLTLDKPYPEDDTRAEKAAAARGLADRLKTTGVPFGVASGAREPIDQPGQLAAWGITDADETVVVVYNRMKIVNRWAFPANKPPTDADIREIVTAFENEAKNR